MITAAFAIGGLGVLAAFALGVAAKVFYVEVDPLVVRIEEALPGANCGGCGQPGCSGAAAAIAAGKMPANGCVAGGAETSKTIAAILGVEVKETEPQIAQVGCRYPIERADIHFDYTGVTDCRAAALLAGGPKECPIGCLGLGSCVRACPFDALSIGPDHLPVVDEEKCTGCGTCVRICPMGIMHLTSVTDRILGEYDWTQCTAPCQRRCPAGIDIPEQIYQTKKGDYGRALAVIKERNPLPLICGRICPNPCELVCRRNMVDQAVAINPLKRFVADWERESGRRQQPYRAPATGRKAAVIGGGVEGLSASAFLARLGHEPVIFEARDQLGGLLRTAIPESRLPREVLDWEIEGILDLGVGAETNRALGRDLSLSQLFDQGFEAVLIATGGWDALLEQGEQALGPAPALPRLYLLLPLTMAWASGRDIDPGQDVAVIGGGKDGLAAARRALDKGARKATALLSADGLKGLEDAVAKSEAAGVEIITGVKVTGLTGVGDHLTGVEYKPKVGPPATLAADTLIAASGRMPEMIIVPEKPAEEEPAPSGENTPWRTRPPYRPMDSGDLFQPREPVSDYRAAVEAIGAGRRAAASIHRVFNGQPLPRLGLDIVHDPPLIDVDHLENPIPAPGRAQAPEVPDDQRSGPAQEIALGLSEEQARRESDRCLTCGLICYLRTQYH